MLGWILFFILMTVLVAIAMFYLGYMFGGTLMYYVLAREKELGRELTDDETGKCAEMAVKQLLQRK